MDNEGELRRYHRKVSVSCQATIHELVSSDTAIDNYHKRVQFTTRDMVMEHEKDILLKCERQSGMNGETPRVHPTKHHLELTT